MEGDDLLDVGQTQTEALHIVDITRVDTIELIEDLLDVLFLDAQTRVADGEAEMVFVVPRADIDVERLLGLTVLHGIVHQVGDGILEVHLIDKDGRIDGFDLRKDMSTRMLYAERETGGHRFQQFIEVELLFLEGGLFAVEHRHLEHFLHEEAQALRLVVDNTTQVLEHRGTLRDGFVVEHLCCQ